MYCWKCGKEISSTAEYCPYCGAGQGRAEAPGMSGSRTDKKYGTDYYLMGIIGFALSCVSLVFSLDGLVPAAGIVVSIIALVHINKLGLSGRGFAIAGIAVGAVRILLSLVIYFYFMHMGIGLIHHMWDGFYPLF